MRTAARHLLTRRYAQPVVTLMLVGLLLAHPFISARQGLLLFVLAALLALFISIRRSDLKLRIYLGISSFVLVWSIFWDLHPGLEKLFLYSSCISTYFIFIFFIIHDLLKTTEITKNEIFSLINCYLIVGTVFSFVYEIIFFSTPESFSFGPHNTYDHSIFLYYSFITITTLGYGDVVPISPFARHIAIIEAIFGQFYIAIVVSYILGKYIQRKLA